ncbi:MAG: type II toxin-antitoxin system mRNA interferase toxin, RelE/StbE family [Lentilactobacillus hilgardii]|uniref:Type II toxin-antitoxin system mRNA interferase toxin, RelE/StbE family n=1 Tax=Lentilactobacillus hilgardii TaxID=1588 RepID=A0A6P1E3T6_LENHI|nr:type II toxin-antitoxin system mRNA interferase toxin, RelE/StbE family [Lentilactobacillus hilgardii]RRG12184.1 MAG: type II toxin-antitoxin system mRNA interferase toxin, RelE/StbE family [Lactobacillus sp.]EEI71921.1 addiction module toxin, RelE/StbE family [Lentilactobacillus hilgardii ATCC 27305]MBZ2201054.1 type II toxin-antitoxin system mRNA interferase toxin, RelE/StbE family [Lentilactobacillus hilgardii]MBZ2203967.1 type II toxin-antitoxin system mRNA interferase toxin, RelE/StbE f
MTTLTFKAKYQSRFKKHYQNMIRANRYSEKEFKAIETVLLSGQHPDQRYDDHVIKSRKPQRALFIKGNWLLIYDYENDTVRFLDTGRHGDI